MTNTRKDLPPVNAPNFLEKVREALSVYMGTRGDVMDRGLTVRDLASTRMIEVSKTFVATRQGSPVGGPGTAVLTAYRTDLTQPPAPASFSAITSKTMIQVIAPAATYTQGNGHAKTIVYGAIYTGGPLPVFGDAVVLTEFNGDVFAFPVDPASTYRLWIRWKSKDGVLSEVCGGTNGVAATAGLLDDANIASLNVSKLRAGAVSVGDYIRSANYVANTSGWRISGDGQAEFIGVTVRGTIFATAGQIGGNTIDSSGMQSPSYVAGVSGWRLASDGSIKAAAASGTRILDLTATGTNPVLKIGSALELRGDGSGTFGGSLDVKSAASGARMEIKNNVIKVFDANGTLRVRLGDLSA